MKKLLLILFLAINTFAASEYCQKLYDNFKATIEPQMTALCITKETGVFSYNFYMHQDSIYADMKLVFGLGKESHLYQKGVDEIDIVELECMEETDDTEDVLKILFANHSCAKEFKELNK